MTAASQDTGLSRGVDAWQVLGLPYSPDLTDADVRAAYLLRMRAVHPDHGGDSRAAAAVTAAYDALRSGVRRGELLTAVTVDRDGSTTGPAPGTRRPRRGHTTVAAGRPDSPAGRAAQGLPPWITDEETLAVIAGRLVVTLGRGQGARAAHPRPMGAAAPRARGSGPVWEPSTWRRESGRKYGAGQDGAGPVAVAGPWLVRGWLRVRPALPARLAARLILAAGVVVIAQVAAPGDPAVWALGVGALTWLIRTGRWDLAPRARR